MPDDDALTQARALLKRAPLFDGHNDLPWVIRNDGLARGDVLAYDLTRVHDKGDTDIPRLREGGVGAQFWSAFQPTSAPHPARTALEQIDLVRRIEAAHPQVFLPARSAADFASARRAGKIASYIVVEGGVGLENSLAPLRVWHAAGVRMLIPCHNETLDWVDSATDAPRHERLQRLRPRGDRRMQPVRRDRRRRARLARGAEAPRSTSARRRSSCPTPTPSALCDHPRNAPDDVLKRLKDNGGVVMATFVPGFVSQALRDWLKASRDGYGKAPLAADPKAQLAELETRRGPAPRATLTQVADHIAYLVETAGIDHVGIGSDFFGGAQPDGLEHVGRFPYPLRRTDPPRLLRTGPGEDRQPQRAARHAQGRARRRSAARGARAGDRQDRGLSGGVRGTPPSPLAGEGVGRRPTDEGPRRQALVRCAPQPRAVSFLVAPGRLKRDGALRRRPLIRHASRDTFSRKGRREAPF